MNILITEEQLKKLIKEELGVSEKVIAASNELFAFSCFVCLVILPVEGNGFPRLMSFKISFDVYPISYLVNYFKVFVTEYRKFLGV